MAFKILLDMKIKKDVDPVILILYCYEQSFSMSLSLKKQDLTSNLIGCHYATSESQGAWVLISPLGFKAIFIGARLLHC